MFIKYHLKSLKVNNLYVLIKKFTTNFNTVYAADLITNFHSELEKVAVEIDLRH